jgi:hypothetical protein
MVIQDVELYEPQLQLAPVVTLTAPVPPDAGMETLVGVTLYVHAAAACETVIV